MEGEIKVPLGDAVQFISKARKGNAEAIEITIPQNVRIMLGIEQGDFLKIWVKKGLPPKEEEKEE